MKVLITGAAGFIGSNLAKFLIEKNALVYAIDNFSTGDKIIIDKLKKYKNFKFYEHDLQKGLPNSLGKLDIIVHLAAKKIPRYENSLETLTSNTKMTGVVLDAARKKKAKVIFASTSDVYGLTKESPLSENSNLVLGPSTVSRWAYAISKIYDEHLCLAYSDKYKIPNVILRFFGVYGPGVNLTWWGGPFGPFISSILEDKVIEIHGTGKQIRCFTYIDDLILGIYLSMTSNKAENEILNIASSEQISISGLVRKIEMVAGKKAKIKFTSYKSFYGGKYQDIISKIPSVKKAEKVIGFKAKTDLLSGIRKTIIWYKSTK